MTLLPPADSPKMVMRFGSPPNAAMCSTTHCSASLVAEPQSGVCVSMCLCVDCVCGVHAVRRQRRLPMNGALEVLVGSIGARFEAHR